jgi:hypothetical protein
MTNASELLRQHFQTLVADNARWQTLIAEDLVWELPYAPSLGHPARLSGRDEVLRHIGRFVGAVEIFRYRRDLRALVYHLLDAGDLALESNGDEIAGLMRAFLGKHIKK